MEARDTGGGISRPMPARDFKRWNGSTIFCWRKIKAVYMLEPIITNEA